MKYVRILCAVALVFALCSAFTMKDKEKAVYAFGVAASIVVFRSVEQPKTTRNIQT